MRVRELDAGLGKRLVFYWRSFALFAADLQNFGLLPAPTGRREHRKIYLVARTTSVSLIGAYCSNVELNKEKDSFLAVTAFNTGRIN
jgi:hypothetical protein